jgi:peptidoglycan-associated lipoprotein
MRQSAWILVLVAAVGLAACHSNPKPKATPPPPIAPATPPPAPAPTASDVVQVSDYDRLKSMATDELERMGLLAEVHFDLDKYDVRDADRAVLSKNAEVLKRYDFLKVTVEGHSDERGSVEYNLALGERRAKSAYDYLVQLGVPADRLKTVSYGKEVPLCQEAAEGCWQRNRRAHFSISGKTTR